MIMTKSSTRLVVTIVTCLQVIVVFGRTSSSFSGFSPKNDILFGFHNSNNKINNSPLFRGRRRLHESMATSVVTSLTGGSSSPQSSSSSGELSQNENDEMPSATIIDELASSSSSSSSSSSDKVTDLVPDSFASSQEEEEVTNENDTEQQPQQVEESTTTSEMADETTTTTTEQQQQGEEEEIPTKPLTRKEKRRLKKEQKKQEHEATKYAKQLKNRNNMNIRRKITHANFGLFFASLNHFIPRDAFVPGMAILTSASLVMELLRYRKGFNWMNNALHFVLGSSLRKHEMEGKFTGSFYFFLGVTITAALFPTTCATMGICQLALADPSASYFGRKTRHIYWSRIENGLGGFGRNKGLLGFVGGALFCFPFNYRVLSIAKFAGNAIPGGRKALVLVSLGLGFAGAFADLAVPTPALHLPEKIWGITVPPFHVDDNLVVPIVSGYACTKIFKMVGWSQELQLAKLILF
mmetsp:Transcript_26822/g.37817  ORF Transcript_26822/g.37817 Transcript_26822/m.37817 type:complete len:467 (-) Transcript_26822:31-1431(-)